MFEHLECFRPYSRSALAAARSTLGAGCPEGARWSWGRRLGEYRGRQVAEYWVVASTSGGLFEPDSVVWQGSVVAHSAADATEYLCRTEMVGWGAGREGRPYTVATLPVPGPGGGGRMHVRRRGWESLVGDAVLFRPMPAPEMPGLEYERSNLTVAV